jgi:predicted Zn-dependent protease
MGRDAFTQMKAKTSMSQDKNATAIVQRVGRRIAAVADLPKAQWEFVLFQNNQANAFCLPGGKVGVYTGLLPIAKTEAGLATVLAHEVAHAVAHHGSERISRVLAIQGLGIAVISQMDNLNSNTRNLLYTAYGLGTTLGSELPHSRLQESEADEIGLIYMARAGYDPKEAIAFWQRFSDYNQKQGNKVPWFLRTHPLDEQRIENLKRLMPRAKLQYRPRSAKETGSPQSKQKPHKKVVNKTVILFDPKDMSRRSVIWKPGLTLYSARRSVKIVAAREAMIERAGKIFSGKPATALQPDDVVRWK